jgi:predicted DNA-binding transcriptional regulator YafY
VAGYKINSNRSVVFLYTSDKQAETEVREIVPFPIVTNDLRYLVVALTK